MRDYQFEDYVGDAESFLEKYFGRQPFFRRRAFWERLGDLQSTIDLDGILALEAMPPYYVRVSKEGVGVPTKSYRRIVGREPVLSEAVIPDKVYDLFSCGATVTWNALEHVVPSVRGLIRPLCETFGCAAEVGLFATPAGNQGLAPHCDSMDVFVVQVYGTKRWKAWATPDHRPGDSTSYLVEELGEPVLHQTLEPGDVLYLPYGTAHVAIAERELSAHLSIGVEPRRWRHVLAETVDMLLADDDRFHQFPLLPRNPDDKTADEFKELLLRLAERLRRVDAECELRRLASSARSRNGAPRREFQRLRDIDSFDANTNLRRRGTEIGIGERTAGRVKLTIGEVQVSVPENLVTALDALERAHTVRASQLLPGAAVGRAVNVAKELARLGLLEVVEEPT